METLENRQRRIGYDRSREDAVIFKASEKSPGYLGWLTGSVKDFFRFYFFAEGGSGEAVAERYIRVNALPEHLRAQVVAFFAEKQFEVEAVEARLELAAVIAKLPRGGIEGTDERVWDDILGAND